MSTASSRTLSGMVTSSVTDHAAAVEHADVHLGRSDGGPVTSRADQPFATAHAGASANVCHAPTSARRPRPSANLSSSDAAAI